MADISITTYTNKTYKSGASTVVPGFVEGSPGSPVNPPGSGAAHNPVTIGSPANGLSITDDQVLTYDGSTIPTAAVIGRYEIDTSGTTAPVGTKDIRYNNATQISATQLFISDITEDNIDVDLFLSLIKQGSALVIQDRDDHLNYQTYEVSGTPTFASATWTFPVTFKDSGGTGTTNFANNHKMLLSALSSGSGTIGGSIAIGQVAFGTGTNQIGGDNGLFWDNINKRLGIGTTTPGNTFHISAFNTSNSQARIASLELQSFALNNAWIGENVFYNGSDFQRRNTGSAVLFYFAGNEGQFRCVGSGSAGTTTGLSNVQFKVNSDGTVALGGAMSNAQGNYSNSTVQISGTTLQVNDAKNIVLGTTTGTKIGTATSQKIGFWNATPIVQPTTAIAESAFVENAGGVNVNDDSTFDGYTIRQVVKALRDAGLLA